MKLPWRKGAERDRCKKTANAQGVEYLRFRGLMVEEEQPQLVEYCGSSVTKVERGLNSQEGVTCRISLRGRRK